MKAKEYVDLLIPRGSAGLIKHTVENATVPVIETGSGICHVFVDKEFDEEMYTLVTENETMAKEMFNNKIGIKEIYFAPGAGHAKPINTDVNR